VLKCDFVKITSQYYYHLAPNDTLLLSNNYKIRIILPFILFKKKRTTSIKTLKNRPVKRLLNI